MNKKRLLAFCLSSMLSSCLLAPNIVAKDHFTPIPTLLSSEFSTASYTIAPRGDVTIWKYKIVNGVKYQRLWNKSKGCWVGDWEKV